MKSRPSVIPHSVVMSVSQMIFDTQRQIHSHNATLNGRVIGEGARPLHFDSFGNGQSFFKRADFVVSRLLEFVHVPSDSDVRQNCSSIEMIQCVEFESNIPNQFYQKSYFNLNCCNYAV